MPGTGGERITRKMFKYRCKNHYNINSNLIITPTINRWIKDEIVDIGCTIHCISKKDLHNNKRYNEKVL